MIVDTVFAPSFGNRPAYLAGRDDVLARFDQALAAKPGTRERATLLLGQRGSGKTVLLWELADRARKAGYVVASPTVATERMLDRIVEKVQEGGAKLVRESRSHVTGVTLGALGFSAGLQFSRIEEESKSLEYKLLHLARALTALNHGVLILVDEVQANSPQMRSLITVYLEMVGEGLDVSLIMAGLPGAVSSTLNDKVLTFLNRASKIQLNPLADGDIDAFLSYGFRRADMHVSPSDRTIAVKAAQGSPYLMQLIGHAFAQRASDNGTLPAGAVEQALSSARDDFQNNVCETTLAALSEKDCAFLSAMALDEKTSRMETIAARMGVTQDYAQKYRKRLKDGGIIEVPRRGYVTFAVPYLREHLQENYL